MGLRTPDIAYRTPSPPAPIEAIDVVHPRFPGGDGLRILHLSDLHIRRRECGSERFGDLCAAVASRRADLVAITGDLMDEPGDEDLAVEALSFLRDAWERGGSGALGAVCVLGNHDTLRLRRALARVRGVLVPGENAPVVMDVHRPGVAEPIRVLGLHWPEDPVGALLEGGGGAERWGERGPDRAFTLALAHHPGALISLADCGVDVALAGHTHAGQVRLHQRFAPHTSSDVPAHLASGVLRYRDTLMCISRGVGDGVVQGLRVNCSRQVPLYRLRRGAIPTPAGWTDARTRVVTQVQSW